MTYKDSEVYLAHKRLGFPPLDKEIQINILLDSNFNPIKSLLPDLKDEGFPLGLLNEYITITKNEFKTYLLQNKYADKKISEYSDTYDGFWIKRHPIGFEFFERERGNIYNHEIFKTEEEVLDPVIKIIGWCCKD